MYGITIEEWWAMPYGEREEFTRQLPDVLRLLGGQHEITEPDDELDDDDEDDDD